MALTREERKLLHRKSQQATFGIGKPNDNDGFNGDISYRKIEGSGTVQYLKEDDSWKAISSSGEMPPLRVVGAGGTTITSLTNHGSLSSLSNDDHTQYLLVSGTRAMTGNLSLGGNDIGSVDALDVDGATTLDKTTINTTDGAFAVTGANQITLTTTSTASDGTGNLDVNVGFNYNLDVSRACDWNTGSTDWDNGGAFNLTTLSDATIETLGTTSSPRTLSLTGGLSDFSKYGLVAISSFIKGDEDGDTTDNQGANGIHIKCDAGNVAGKHNNIFIEQKNQSQKGSGYGINLKSSNGIKIETSNNLTSQPTSIIMEAPANGTIDIGLGSVSPNAAPNRVMVHGVFETSNLYRPSDGTSDTADIITTDIGTGLNGTASGEHVQFQALNTYNLIRAVSRVVKNTTVLFTDATCDTTSGDATVTFTSTGNANAGLISDGMKVTGTGIPTDSFVTSKTTSSFELRNASNNPVNATANGTNVTLSFFNYTNTLYNNDFILIATIIDNDDDDYIGTMWKISITYQAGGNDYAQVWYCAKQSAKFAWLGNSNYDVSAGLTLSADDKGIVTWTSTNGIRWQNATGGTVTSVRCSALKIHSGNLDF